MTTKPEYIEREVFQVQGVYAGSHEGDLLVIDNHRRIPPKLEAVPDTDQTLEEHVGRAASRIVRSIKRAS